MEKFAKKLQEIRKQKKISQNELAYLLTAKQQTISKWENGILEPSYNDLTKIAIYFDVTTDFLLGLENEAGGKIPQPFIDNSQFKNANLGNNRGTITINTNNKKE